MSVKVLKKLEEHWTPTTMQAAFTLHLTSPRSSDFSVDLPLPSLGWFFALSFSPRPPTLAEQKKGQKKGTKTYDWLPVALSLRQHGDSDHWGDTFLQAQLSLALKQRSQATDTTPTSEMENTTQNNMFHNTIPIGSLETVLSREGSATLALTTAGFVSLDKPTKICLNVTISGCPFSNGLFRSDPADRIHEAEARVGLVRQCGDRLLTRSLATGKSFDAKFLARSTLTRTGKPEKLRQTYASLFVLEQKIDLLSSKLGDEWKNILSAPKHNGKADVKHAGEILCPDGYEYELDSDLEDEDSEQNTSTTELCTPPSSIESDSNSICKERKPQSDCGTERSHSSMSSFELYQPEEIIQSSVEPHHEDDEDNQITFLVKFAAHRTWRAFLWYCYTGRVEFSHLKSQHSAQYPDFEDGPPFCSPKSMYRLAVLVGNKDLKDKALKAIGERMNEKNILEETFSVFTSKFPDVRRVQMNILLEHIGSPEVKGEFVNMMRNFTNMPHAEPVLLALCDRLVAAKE